MIRFGSAWICSLSVLVLSSAACDGGLAVEDELGVVELEARVCADGPTVEGIDVSKWQSTIDWDAVATSNVEFAFIRVSDGLSYPDGEFDRNWSEARRVGITRGVYQYFRPGQNPIEQANLLLDAMGTLEPGDLPPVLDVEAADGQSAGVIVDKIHQWVDHVEAATGTTPIIYTAKYFWQDSVGAPADFLDMSLWVANYGVECPLIADPWPRWDFWQYTSSGSVSGIGGNVDRNVFNGTSEELAALTVQAIVCGDGSCEGDETAASCPADCDDGGGQEPVCGDGSCEGGETATSCPDDCDDGGGEEPVCGDGTCEGDETATSCPADCDGGGGQGDDDDDGQPMVSGGCAAAGGGGRSGALAPLLLALGFAVRRRRR